MSAVASACANPVAESFLICANYSSALYSAGVGMCGNNDSIEKHLFCRGGQNREGLAEIANIAMMEFAAHFNFPHIRRLCPCREKKVKPQSPFKTLANILQGFLFPALRVSHMFGGGPSGRNRSKSCFVLWSRRKKVSKLKSAIRIRPDPLIFPQPPIISRHFRFRIFSNVNGERERMFYAVSVAGRGQRMENIGKSFVKVLTFLGKYVFWGIIKIK